MGLAHRLADALVSNAVPKRSLSRDDWSATKSQNGLRFSDRSTTGFDPTPKAESNERAPAGTTEGDSSTRFCVYRSEGRSGIAHG
jgi:hypothetical protein